MNQYLAQLEQLAVPLAIAAVIFVFSLISFGVWASRIRQVRAEVHTKAAAAKRWLWLKPKPVTTS
jgi:hypothetical protein